MGVYKYQNGFWLIQNAARNVPRGAHGNVDVSLSGNVSHYKIFWDRGSSTKVTGVAQVLTSLEA